MKKHLIIHIIKKQAKAKRSDIELKRDQKELSKYEVIS